MKTLGSLLSSAMSRAGIGYQIHAAQIVTAGNAALEDEFGNGILDHAACMSYVDQNLITICRNSTVGQEISMREHSIIERITRTVPRAQVQKIIIRHKSTTERIVQKFN
jgi:hypothetical protein